MEIGLGSNEMALRIAFYCLQQVSFRIEAKTGPLNLLKYLASFRHFR